MHIKNPRTSHGGWQNKNGVAACIANALCHYALSGNNIAIYPKIALDSVSFEHIRMISTDLVGFRATINLNKTLKMVGTAKTFSHLDVNNDGDIHSLSYLEISAEEV